MQLLYMNDNRISHIYYKNVQKIHLKLQKVQKHVIRFRDDPVPSSILHPFQPPTLSQLLAIHFSRPLLLQNAASMAPR